LPRSKRHTQARQSAGENRVFVDSSAWIALFSARDQHHSDADRTFRRAVERRMTILTTNLVLAEVHRLLLFRAGMRPALAALDRIEASPLVRIEFPGDAHHRSARAWLEKLAGHSVTYADAVSFAVMQSSKCSKVATFDRDFEIAGFELLLTNQ
jgi:uncharacterized protein